MSKAEELAYNLKSLILSIEDMPTYNKRVEANVLIDELAALSESPKNQAELWDEVLNTCQGHYINDIRLLEMLSAQYTLRKNL